MRKDIKMTIILILIFLLCCGMLISMARRMDEMKHRIDVLDAALCSLRPELEQEKRWSEALNSILNYSRTTAMRGGDGNE